MGCRCQLCPEMVACLRLLRTRRDDIPDVLVYIPNNVIRDLLFKSVFLFLTQLVDCRVEYYLRYFLCELVGPASLSNEGEQVAHFFRGEARLMSGILCAQVVLVDFDVNIR